MLPTAGTRGYSRAQVAIMTKIQLPSEKAGFGEKDWMNMADGARKTNKTRCA